MQILDNLHKIRIPTNSQLRGTEGGKNIAKNELWNREKGKDKQFERIGHIFTREKQRGFEVLELRPEGSREAGRPQKNMEAHRGKRENTSLLEKLAQSQNSKIRGRRRIYAPLGIEGVRVQFG